MTKLHSNQTDMRGIVHVSSPRPQIILRKNINKERCCDYPDWNDCKIDALGNPFIQCENCEAMCFD